MLISRNHLLAVNTISSDNARPMLTKIKLYRDGDYVVSVSTDSYILSEIKEKVPEDSDYPLEPEHMGGSQLCDEQYISVETVKGLKPYMKSFKALPILGFAQVHKDGVFATDLDKSVKLYEKPVEGKYPEYRKLLPEPSAFQVHLNPKLLKKALSVFDSEHSVTIEFGKGKLDPVILRSEYQGVIKTVVVMPLKN